MAEIELSILSRQCLNCRIPNQDTLYDGPHKPILWTLFLQYYQGLQWHRTLFSRSEKAQTCN